MWFKVAGVTGTGESFDADDIEAAFNLIGLEFDYLITVDDDTTISKQARRFCYQNKLHDNVKKIQGGLVDALINEAGVLVHFGCDLAVDVDSALFGGIPVFLFPENFKSTLAEGWSNGG